MESRLPYLLRAFAMPFQTASLLFVSFVAAFYFLCAAVLGQVPYLWILPACFAIFAIVKYGYLLLGAAANGKPVAPVPSLEALGPFDGPGPIGQLLCCVLLYLLARELGGAFALWVGAAALLVLPASMAVQGSTHHVLDAVNPLVLGRLIRALAWHYLLVLALLAIEGAVAALICRLDWAELPRDIVLSLLALSAFALIGGVIYECRLEVGHEPQSSPERNAARVREARDRERQQMLDDVYGPMRARDYRLALAPLEKFLDAAPPDELGPDAPSIMAQVAQWNDQRGLATVARCVVSRLLRKSLSALALAVADETCSRLSRFSLESETETVAVSRYAKAVGRSRLALLLLDRLAAARPEEPLGPEATALRSELKG